MGVSGIVVGHLSVGKSSIFIAVLKSKCMSLKIENRVLR